MNDDNESGTTRMLILPPGGEWLIVRPSIDDAAEAVTTSLGQQYRAVELTDQFTALIADLGDAETNPYLPRIGALYGVRLSGRGSAVFTGGRVRVGTQERVMPLPAVHASRIRDLVEDLKSRTLTIRPLHHE